LAFASNASTVGLACSVEPKDISPFQPLKYDLTALSVSAKRIMDFIDQLPNSLSSFG
jgi:hypothetical protein